MKTLLGTTMLIAIAATAAQAGGIERNRLNNAILFEDGNYVELGFNIQQPEISGDYPLLLGGGETENMTASATFFSLGYKQQVTPELAFALLIGQPYAANAEYTQGFYDGLAAEWNSNELRLLAAYEFMPGWTGFGGARVVQSTAAINVASPLPYLASGGQVDATGTPTPGLGNIIGDYRNDEAPSETDFGFILGVAYERPEIALRVGLTYESTVTHSFSTTERYGLITTTGLASRVDETETEVELPQAVTLDFQSGVAPKTLVFGSVRWVDWTEFEVRSPSYDEHTGDDFVSYDNDTITYRLGVGYQATEQLGVFGQIGYEDAKGGAASRLAPTDGSTSIGVGAEYAINNISIRGGLEYVILGDATDASEVSFKDSNVLGAGLTIGFSF